MLSQVDDIADGLIRPQHFNKYASQRYTFEPFDTPPSFSNSLGNGAAVGTNNAINLIHTENGIYEWHVVGTQTIVVPVFDRINGLGLDFAQDITSNEGHQLWFASLLAAGSARAKHTFTVGRDTFFARLRVRAADTSGLTSFAFGFIKVQTYQSFYGNYTDGALLSASALGASARIFQDSALNGGGFASLNTSQLWLDNQARTFEIRVARDGRVKFVLDGVAPTVEKRNFVFDSGDVLAPISAMTHSADGCDTFFYQEFEAGLLAERGGV